MAFVEEIEEEKGQGVKRNMTEQERLDLAAQMDRELDDFIDSLEKRGYTEGWPEDRWEEEMDKHPFFMKEPPKPGDELHPLLEGIQQLKYDSMENTLEDLATTYKEDGNFDIKNKKYRMAIFSYTEGLRQKCENIELNASLYNNRSAAHFFLKNYRSSFIDAKKAVALKPEYEKAEFRMAQCSFNLKRYGECIDVCNKYTEKYGQGDKICELRRKAREHHLQKLRDERKEQSEQRRKGETLKQTIDELKKRHIKFEEQVSNEKIPFEHLIVPQYIPLQDFPIQMTESGHLRWPAVFCYPEFVICDFQQQLNDEIALYDILCDLFAEPMPEDKQYQYRPDTVNVYYENRVQGKLHKLDASQTVKQITSDSNFLVGMGVLTFQVVTKDTDAEKLFLSKERTKLNMINY